MYEKKRKIPGTVSGIREGDAQYTDVLKVLLHYSDKFNIEFKSNKKAIELAHTCRCAYKILRDCMNDDRIEILEKMK